MVSLMSKKGMEPTLLEALSMYFSIGGVKRLKAWEQAGQLNMEPHGILVWPPEEDERRVIEAAIRTGKNLFLDRAWYWRHKEIVDILEDEYESHNL